MDQIWGQNGVTFGSFWGHLGHFGTFWHRFAVFFAVVFVSFRPQFGSFWDHFDVCFDPFLDGFFGGFFFAKTGSFVAEFRSTICVEALKTLF